MLKIFTTEKIHKPANFADIPVLDAFIACYCAIDQKEFAVGNLSHFIIYLKVYAIQSGRMEKAYTAINLRTGETVSHLSFLNADCYSVPATLTVGHK